MKVPKLNIKVIRYLCLLNKRCRCPALSKAVLCKPLTVVMSMSAKHNSSNHSAEKDTEVDAKT